MREVVVAIVEEREVQMAGKLTFGKCRGLEGNRNSVKNV